MEWKAKMQQRMKALGVEDLGRISHGEVAELYRKANIFAYPSELAEIDCISLSKAMAAGAIPITTDFGRWGRRPTTEGCSSTRRRRRTTGCSRVSFIMK